MSSVIVGVVKAQEDVTGGQKRDGEVEEEEEDPYNEENLEQVGSRRVSAVSLLCLLSWQVFTKKCSDELF